MYFILDKYKPKRTTYIVYQRNIIQLKDIFIVVFFWKLVLAVDILGYIRAHYWLYIFSRFDICVIARPKYFCNFTRTTLQKKHRYLCRYTHRRFVPPGPPWCELCYCKEAQVDGPLYMVIVMRAYICTRGIDYYYYYHWNQKSTHRWTTSAAGVPESG